MKKFGYAVAGAFLVLLVILPAHVLPAQAQPVLDDGVAVEIPVQVSPSTILLNWKAKGDVKITVHADVSFSLFDPRSFDITLVNNDGTFGTASAYYIKADARGDLVAKFRFEEIAQMVGPGTATLSLTAVARNGTVYTGEDEVRVVGD